MDRELVPVGFSIANRKYDYKVPKELEAGVRRLASEIKDRFLELKTNFNLQLYILYGSVSRQKNKGSKNEPL